MPNNRSTLPDPTQTIQICNILGPTQPNPTHDLTHPTTEPEVSKWGVVVSMGYSAVGPMQNVGLEALPQKFSKCEVEIRAF